MRELMNTTIVLRLVPCAMLIGFILMPRIAEAQTLKEQIVGTWRQVSIYNEEGGVKRHLYGDTPVGLAVFDHSGSYHLIPFQAGLPNSRRTRLRGSDAEYEPYAGHDCRIWHLYRRWRHLTINWIASSYPNRDGTAETRTYKVPAMSDCGQSDGGFRRPSLREVLRGQMMPAVEWWCY